MGKGSTDAAFKALTRIMRDTGLMRKVRHGNLGNKFTKV